MYSSVINDYMNTHLEINKRLSCPACFRNLIFSRGSYICPHCSHTYLIKAGIPIFSNNTQYLGEVEKSELEFINERLEKQPLDTIVRTLEKDTRELISFLLGADRAHGLDVLKIRSDDYVLDLGAGYGGLSLAIADTGAHVDSVEWVMEKLVFLRSLARQRGLENINCIKADCKTLPYAPETFTKIIMNGFLEWIPLEFLEMKPKNAQIRVLQKCHDLLKDSGRLFIGIENRCWYPYFLGYHDPHERRLRFVTILPRCIANIISYVWRGKPYRTHIYTSRGYKKLLHSVGFKDVQVYGVMPSYVEPDTIVEEHSLNNYFADCFHKGKMTIKKLVKCMVLHLGLSKFFVHSFILVARK